MKKFILGFVLGAMLFSGVFAVSAAVEYRITPNPFKVTVDGVEKTLEAYNINDSTYFKLRDISDALGGMFNVDFKNNTIIIDTKVGDTLAKKKEESSKTTSSATEAIDGLPVVYEDGKNEPYVSLYTITDKYGPGLFIMKDGDLYSIYFKGKLYFKHHPQYKGVGDSFMGVSNGSPELEWYNTVLYPWIRDVKPTL